VGHFPVLRVVLRLVGKYLSNRTLHVLVCRVLELLPTSHYSTYSTKIAADQQSFASLVAKSVQRRIVKLRKVSWGALMWVGLH